jgi:hypothetical protein
MVDTRNRWGDKGLLVPSTLGKVMKIRINPVFSLPL